MSRPRLLTQGLVRAQQQRRHRWRARLGWAVWLAGWTAAGWWLHSLVGR
jgi:hypothetical protein